MRGTDGYTQNGTAFGGATATMASSEPIPGGATGVKDTVVAKLKVGDAEASSSTWGFTFQ
jgi:hypothetical protein